MSIYKDNKKTKDGRAYFFQIMKNGKLYKSKRYLTRKEALQEEAQFILRFNPKSKRFSVVAEEYFKNINNYCLKIYFLNIRCKQCHLYPFLLFFHHLMLVY